MAASATDQARSTSAATARTKAAFQVCRAATATTTLETSTTLEAAGTGGVLRPMGPMRGTEA